MTTALAGLFALWVAGCEGELAANAGADQFAHPDNQRETPELGPGASSTDDPVLPVQPIDSEECANIEPTPVANVPARILTTQELNNALQTLFPNVDDLPSVEMTYDSRVGSFVLNAREQVSTAHVRDFRLMAEEVATLVAADPDTIAPCDTSDESALSQCVEAVISDLGSRAFRRPLTETEKQGLMGLYVAGSDTEGHGGGMRFVVEAMLQSPSFMYVTEDVSQPALDEYEIAQRMAALLWRAIPDDELLEAARAGELSSAATREAQARRMIDDDRGKQMMRSLVLQWLGFDQLEHQAFAQQESNAALVRAMGDETIRLVDHVVEEANSSWAELLNSRYTFVDATLAEHYGVSLDDAEEVSDGVFRVEMSDRAGLLSHAGFLALQHGPVHRGLAIRKAILCGDVPGPTGIDTEAIPTEPEESERSKSTKRLEEGGCAGCHRMMDPLGLTFDTFGLLGEPRTEDRYGNPVTSDGEIYATIDVDGEVADATELVNTLSQSETVRECVSKNLFTWAFARPPAGPDGCTVAGIEEALVQSDDNLREALVAIIADEMFTRRAVAGGQQ